MAQSEGVTISKSQCCKLLGCSRQWLNRLQSDGFIPEGPRGRVPLVGAVQGYIHWLNASASRRGGEDAARVASARASELELRNRQKSATLVPRREIAIAIDEVERLADAELRKLPPKIKTTPESRARIAREAREARERIAETRAASERFLADGGPLP